MLLLALAWKLIIYLGPSLGFVLSYWLFPRQSAAVKTAANVVGSLCAIGSCLCWILSAVFGNEAKSMSDTFYAGSGLLNLWAARLALNTALLFILPYCLDDIEKRREKRGKSFGTSLP